jgi:hypothetical protein
VRSAPGGPALTRGRAAVQDGGMGERGIPVTPRGAATGQTAGAVALGGGK